MHLGTLAATLLALLACTPALPEDAPVPCAPDGTCAGEDVCFEEKLCWTPSASPPARPEHLNAVPGAEPGLVYVTWDGDPSASSYRVIGASSRDGANARVLQTSTQRYYDWKAPVSEFSPVETYLLLIVQAVGPLGYSTPSGLELRRPARPVLNSSVLVQGLSVRFSWTPTGSECRIGRTVPLRPIEFFDWQTGRQFEETPGFGGQIDYVVQCRDGGVTSPYSKVQTLQFAQPPPPAPSEAPKGLRATVNGTSGTLSWDAVPGASKYLISVNGTLGSESFTNSAYIYGDAGSTVEYAVRAANQTGIGPPSSLSVTYAPATPPYVQVFSLVGGSEVLFGPRKFASETWQLERGATEQGPFESVPFTESPDGRFHYTSSGIPAWEIRWYRSRRSNAGGASPPSPPVPVMALGSSALQTSGFSGWADASRGSWLQEVVVPFGGTLIAAAVAACGATTVDVRDVSGQSFANGSTLLPDCPAEGPSGPLGESPANLTNLFGTGHRRVSAGQTIRLIVDAYGGKVGLATGVADGQRLFGQGQLQPGKSLLFRLWIQPVGAEAPLTPVVVDGSLPGIDQALLYWSASPAATSYTVFRSDPPGTELLEVGHTAEVSFVVKDFGPQTRFQVQARRGAETASLSSPRTVTSLPSTPDVIISGSSDLVLTAPRFTQRFVVGRTGTLSILEVMAVNGGRVWVKLQDVATGSQVFSMAVQEYPLRSSFAEPLGPQPAPWSLMYAGLAVTAGQVLDLIVWEDFGRGASVASVSGQAPGTQLFDQTGALVPDRTLVFRTYVK